MINASIEAGSTHLTSPNHPDFWVEASSQLIASLDLEQVLTNVIQQAQTLLAGSSSFICLIENSQVTRNTHHAEGAGLEPETLTQMIKNGQGTVGRAYLTRQIVACADYWADLQIKHNAVADAKIRKANLIATLALPIILEGEVVALLGVSKKFYYNWTTSDLAQAEQFGRLAAIAIQNARLHARLQNLNQKLAASNHELQTRNLELEARQAELEALQEFNRRLRGPVELQPMAQHALALVIEHLGADGGTIHLLDQNDPEDLVLTVEQGFVDYPKQWAERAKIGSGLIGRAVQTGQSILIEDVKQWQLAYPGSTFLADPLWRTGLFIPLLANGRPIGVIGLGTYAQRSLSSEQVRFAEMMAAQVATAVQHVSRREMQREFDQLTAVLTLARTVAHELNQPLAVLQVEMDFLTMQGEPLDEDSFERMQQSITEITNQVREYQKIIRFETTEPLPGLAIIDKSKALNA